MVNQTVGGKLLSILIIFAFLSLLAVPMGLAQEPEYQDEGSTASEAGLGVGSGLLSLVYFPAKLAFALGGGLVGGLAYLFSGLDDQPAQKIWTTSLYGTYLITPDHLKGNKAVRFLGVAENE